MNNEYWFKQTVAAPLFPELIWSRPENRQLAGKLLVVGGNLHGFAAPAKAFYEASSAGIGTARVLMPDAIKTLLGNSQSSVIDMEYAPSTPSGSFAINALEDLLSLSHWADGVLIAGDLGQNSETIILLEKFIEKYRGQLTVTGDSTEYFTKNYPQALQRELSTFVMSLAQLQKVFMQAHSTKPITSNIDLLRLVEVLHEFTMKYPVNLIVKHDQTIFVAVKNQVSSTAFVDNLNDWQGKIAAHAAVWWLQNPDLAFKALTSSLIAGKRGKSA